MKDPITNPVPVYSIDQIDLDSHAVIEASAGTGKTYTIENLVTTLLTSGKVANLEEILVVTFTEKAAGELKERIREKIQAALKNHESEILQMSLDNFDSASIFTIHGFCNKVLQEYAFENGEQFQNELVDDRTVYQQALYHLMREIWPNRFGMELKTVLRISRYPGTTGNGISSWENRAIEVTIRYQPSGNDILVPDSETDLLALIHDAEAECQAYLDDLEQLIGSIDTSEISNSEFPLRYSTLNINKRSVVKRLQIIEAIVKFIADRKSKNFDLIETCVFFSGFKLKEDGFHKFNTQWKKEGPDYEDKLPNLMEIIELLQKLRTFNIQIIQNTLTAVTVRDLKRLAFEYKKTRGLISYDDMVNRVYYALTGTDTTIKKVLHQKYRYALVDEFQDTDMLQWKIFRAIFLDSRTSRLFIIGDPKQSIYGFRGADVHAYYIARDEMIHHFNAHYYCLDENWRSSPDLITTFNMLFAEKNWFTDSNIRYLPSHYPEGQNPDAHKDRKSLLVLDCGICSGSAAKYQSARFAADEIKRLISEDQTIDLNEIAILVTKWKEAEIIEKFLKKRNISYSLYKKEGLYQSKEVLELALLLASIASPSDLVARKKALLTRFFRVPVHQLLHYDGLAQDHPSDILFERWVNYAEQKKWPLLFQSFFEDTGILYCASIDDYDRTHINYRTVLQNLAVEAYRNDFCIQDIIDHLASLRRKDSYSQDNNIQTIDLDKPGVQILTIHASKGLQFKTVFIAGGFTQKIDTEFWTYHTDSCRVFDLVKDSSNRTFYDLETAGEYERLFYVALTRARDRLYIPFFEPSSRSKKSAGMLGNKLHSALNLMRHENQVSWLEIHTIKNFDVIESKPAIKSVGTIVLPDPLFPGTPGSFIDRKIFIDSFSGLKTKLYHNEPGDLILTLFGNPDMHTDEDTTPYLGIETKRSARNLIPELPRSKESGIMLHAVLEQIDFQKAGNFDKPSEIISAGTESSFIINNAITNHMDQFDSTDIDLIRNQTAQILWNTLNAPLNGSDLLLKHLHDKIHEVEFYYPSHQITSNHVPETACQEGFMHGYIDMIFLFKNKYFIVDWKSNFIEEGYSRNQLEQNIREMHYDLQMSIYFAAVIRWLKKTIPDYSYDNHFGGIYYLYLRGMNPSNPQNGIYFYRPDNDEMANSILIQ